MPPDIVPLSYIEYGLCGDVFVLYPKPHSIYLRGTVCEQASVVGRPLLFLQKDFLKRASQLKCQPPSSRIKVLVYPWS